MVPTFLAMPRPIHLTLGSITDMINIANFIPYLENEVKPYLYSYLKYYRVI